MTKRPVARRTLIIISCLVTMAACRQYLPEEGDEERSIVLLKPSSYSGPQPLELGQEATIVFSQTLDSGPYCTWQPNWRNPQAEGLTILSVENDNFNFRQTVRVKIDEAAFWGRLQYASQERKDELFVEIEPRTSNVTTPKIRFPAVSCFITLKHSGETPWDRAKTGDFHGVPKIEVLGTGDLGTPSTTYMSLTVSFPITNGVVDIRNRSTDTVLRVTGVVMSGDPAFVLSSGQATSFEVAPQGSHQMNYTFNPTETGKTYTATMVIMSNDPKFGNLTAPLKAFYSPPL